ncbi:hypothetical protein [Streptomyces shenzhenensis]|uniref:hypothetical protein n=1 Tax=Streptomyces shenzhenensis TaxID=943815 RepID=UPI00368FB087
MLKVSRTDIRPLRLRRRDARAADRVPVLAPPAETACRAMIPLPIDPRSEFTAPAKPFFLPFFTSAALVISQEWEARRDDVIPAILETACASPVTDV